MMNYCANELGRVKEILEKIAKLGGQIILPSPISFEEIFEWHIQNTDYKAPENYEGVIHLELYGVPIKYSTE